MKKLIFLFIPIIMLLSCSTFSKKVEENYGCTKGDCEKGNGTYVFYSDDSYTGEFKDNKMNGTGTMKYKDGNIYTGHWDNNRRNGTGILFYSNGDEYEGNFFDDVPDGKGKYTYADGTIEKGFFAYSLFTGQIILPKEGDKQKTIVSKVVDFRPSDFEVTILYAEGLKIGDKLFVEVNGTMCSLKVFSLKYSITTCKMIGGTRFLVFQLSKDLPIYRIMKGIKREGNTFLFPNGNKYIGEYKGNLMNGKGEFKWTNGTTYKGEFKNGMRNGKGILDIPGKSRYEGEFKNGYIDGIGAYMTVIIEGKYGYIYDGQWKKGIKSGRGKLYVPGGGGYIYEGDFSNNRKNGKGKYTFAYGDVYIGEFKDDNMHGNGIQYTSDGTIYQEGRWENGMFMGK